MPGREWGEGVGGRGIRGPRGPEIGGGGGCWGQCKGEDNRWGDQVLTRLLTPMDRRIANYPAYFVIMDVSFQGSGVSF